MEESTGKRILNLAIPATIENLLQTLVGFVDTLLIAKIGLMAVTAVGVANTILNVYLAIFIALGVGTSSLIAQKLGAKDRAGAVRIAEQSTFSAVIIGLLFGLLTLTFGKPLLGLMGAADQVMAYSTAFFYIVGGNSVFLAVMTIFGSILRASAPKAPPAPGRHTVLSDPEPAPPSPYPACAPAHCK